MFARRKLIRYCTMLTVLALFALPILTHAQDAAPIAIGQNTVSELTANTPTAAYTLTSTGGDSALIQVLALSPNFIPAFRILNPAGVEILAAPNTDAQASLTASASFLDAGDYTIEISGFNGTLGQFVLSLQAGAPLPDPVELAADQPVSAAISSQTPLAIYHFSTPPTDPLVLTVLTDAPDAGLLLSLYDETAAKTIAASDASLSGIVLRLPATETSYRLEIRASSNEATPYSICLGTCETISLFTASAQVSTPAATPELTTTTCTVTVASGGTVNIRSGPGTQFTAIGTLFAGQPLPLLGQLAGGTWLQVSLSNGTAGWVAASVTRLEGDCAALPLVAAPANAPLAPTLPPPPVPTNPPPPTASSGSSAPPPTAVPSPVPPPTQPDMSVAINSVTPISGGFNVIFIVTVRDAPLPEGYSFEICLDNNCNTIGQGALPTGDDAVTVMISDELLEGRRIAHTLSVTVDSGGVIAESNESNNVATYNFQ